MEFYRYEMSRYANPSFNDEYSGYHIGIDSITLNLHKETDKGYWIGYGNGEYVTGQKWDLKSQSRWVSKTARKRYAYPTKEEAKNNFIKRTEKRLRILQRQIEDSKLALNLINNQK